MEARNAPNPADLLAVRSRVSWGAIAAGAMVALTIYIVLTLLGVALGIEAAVRGTEGRLGIGTAIYSIVVLLLANAFFVAAEYAFVRVRATQLQELVGAGSLRAKKAAHIVTDLDSYISAIQLGVTLASLGLGFVGEPAVGSLVKALQGADFEVAREAARALVPLAGKYAELLLALSFGFSFCLSPGKPVLYALRVAVLTRADAAAAMIGTGYGRRLFEVEAGTKSLEGVAMFFLVTWTVARILSMLLPDIRLVHVVLLQFVIAACGPPLAAALTN